MIFSQSHLNVIIWIKSEILAKEKLNSLWIFKYSQFMEWLIHNSALENVRKLWRWTVFSGNFLCFCSIWIRSIVLAQYENEWDTGVAPCTKREHTLKPKIFTKEFLQSICQSWPDLYNWIRMTKREQRLHW